MSSTARRKPPKIAAPPIDLAEMEQDPGFRGMLSFLEVSAPGRAEAQIPQGDSPTDLQKTAPDLFPGTGRRPMGQLPTGIPYMDVEGRGRRPLRYCQTVQDGHTSSEHLVYQALWNHALQHGRAETSGSIAIDIGLSQLCALLATDHKNVKRLLGSLQTKLALEIVRQPDYRLAVPTRYRVFSPDQILERRRAAGLVWVIRTRAIRFVDLETVQRLMAGEPVGESPMGLHAAPTGETPMGQPPVSLVSALNQWITIEDESVRQIWDACRRGSPECSEEEVLWFCRSKEPLIRSGAIDNPAGLLIRSVPPLFENGGGPAVLDYRKEQARSQERDRKRQRQVAMTVLDDADATVAEISWAREILAAS